MDFITITNTLSGNIYQGFKINHQRDLPRNNVILSNYDNLIDANGLMGNEISIYFYSNSKGTKNKYFILIKDIFNYN
jgi:GH25 family lysozyme M1 (1,4-beta-N-acetylmuramidase)